MGRKRILVVDFEPRRVAATRDWLVDHGYDVVVASSGPELDAILTRRPPVVVLVEPMLPGRDGFALCRALKRGEFGLVPRVILASRLLRGERNKSQARAAGADLFLERPRQDETLLPAIERCFELGPEATPASPSAVRTTGTGVPADAVATRVGTGPPPGTPGTPGPATGGVARGVPGGRGSAGPAGGVPASAPRAVDTGAATATLDISRDVSSEDELDRIIDDAFADIAVLGGGATKTGAQTLAASVPSEAAPTAPPPAAAPSPPVPTGPAGVGAGIGESAHPDAAENTGPPPASQALAARKTGGVPAPPAPPAEPVDPLAGLVEEFSGPVSGAQPLADAVGPEELSGVSGPLSGPAASPAPVPPASTAAPAPSPSIPLADRRPTAPRPATGTLPGQGTATLPPGPAADASGRRGLLLAVAVALVTVGLVVGGWTLVSRRSEPIDVTPVRPVPGAAAPAASGAPDETDGQGTETLPGAGLQDPGTASRPGTASAVQGASPGPAVGREPSSPVAVAPRTVPAGTEPGAAAAAGTAGAEPPAAAVTEPVPPSARPASRASRGPERESPPETTGPAVAAPPRTDAPPPGAVAPIVPAEAGSPPVPATAGPAAASPAGPVAGEPDTPTAGTSAPVEDATPESPVGNTPPDSAVGTAPATTARPADDAAPTSPSGPAPGGEPTGPEPQSPAGWTPAAPADAVPRKEPADGTAGRSPGTTPAPLVGGAAAAVAPPELIASTRVAPVYPARARRFRHRCRVTLEILIDTTGAVREAKIVEETIRGFGFGREAQRAVRQWRYTPARVHGRPVEYREKVVINFVP